MNSNLMQRCKKCLAFIIVLVMIISLCPVTAINAENKNEKWEYTLFAGSSESGSITVNAGNFCVNGDVATNGKIVSTGNMNINGKKTELVSKEMIYIFDKIDNTYFSSNNVNVHYDNYIIEKNNINVDEATEIIGEMKLTGNINISSAVKSYKNIYFYGDVENGSNAVIYSKYGNIVIESNNVNLSGFIYAPFGTVEITAQNVNLNNVVIIANVINIDCMSINANFSESVAKFVGNSSEGCSIPYNEWKYLEDTDSDDLPDLVEQVIIGSDYNNIDSDSDGLPDGYEVLSLGTSPIDFDTDENNVNDTDEDFDNDNLNNLNEYLSNTYPLISDSDDDDLFDGDEINTYYTNPLVVDTDSDGLDDGEESSFDCVSTNPDTDNDGVLDGDEIREQTLVHYVNDESSAVETVSVTMKVKGNINKTTSIESVMNKDMLCTEVVGLIGEPFSIETESKFDKAIITFKIDESKLVDTDFEDLLFLWYDEENEQFVELETNYNYNESFVSIETTHFSKYMIVDKNKWFEAWAVKFNYNPGNSYSGAPLVSYNTVLAIDCSGSMSSNDPITINSNINSATDAKTAKSCHRIEAAEGFIDNMNMSDKASVVFFTGSAQIAAELTDDKNALKLALQNVTSSGGTSFNAAITTSVDVLGEIDSPVSNANNRIILLSDGQSSVSDLILKTAVEHKIKIYTIGLGSGSNDSVLKYIAEQTEGEFYKAYTADELVGIYTEVGLDEEFDTTDTDGDGLYDAIETAGIRLINGKIIYTDPTLRDTDGDGLLDGEEIDPNICKNNIEIPSMGVKRGYYFRKYSNPNSADGDGDAYSDYDEVNQHDSNPNLNDVDLYRWGQGFVSVDYAGTEEWTNRGSNASYGGSQMWLFDDGNSTWYSQFGMDYIIQNYGCGLISTSDILLYLAKTNTQYETDETEQISKNGITNIDYNEYIEYVNDMNGRYLTVVNWVGVAGPNIKTGIETYSSVRKLDLKAKWCVSKEKMLPRIKEMLNNDIPVTFAIGPSVDKDAGVVFYTLQPQTNNPYNLVKDAGPVRGHYVTITGMMSDDISNKKILEISSWGKKYYIDYDEYMDYVDAESSHLFSNIVYITK